MVREDITLTCDVAPTLAFIIDPNERTGDSESRAERRDAQPAGGHIRLRVAHAHISTRSARGWCCSRQYAAERER